MRVYTRKYNIIAKLVPSVLFYLIIPFINPILLGFVCTTIVMVHDGQFSSALVCGISSFIVWIITMLIVFSAFEGDKNIFYNNICPIFKLCSKKKFTIEMVTNKIKG